MEEKKRVAISGAGGFIGSFLTNYFTEKEYEVIPLHRELFLAGNREKLHTVVGSCEIIINLAGAPILHRWTKSYKKELLDSRVKTTSSLVEAIHQAPVKPAIFISASAIGFYPSEGCYDEYNARQGSGFLAGVCEQWEKEALQASPEVRTVITRFGVIFAPKGGAFEKLAGPAALKVTPLLGSGKQSLPWLSIYDLARAMEFLINRIDLSGVFNFTVPEHITYRDFAHSVASHYKTLLTARVPASLLRMVLGEAATFITENPCAIPTRLQEEGFEYKEGTLKNFLDSL